MTMSSVSELWWRSQIAGNRGRGWVKAVEQGKSRELLPIFQRFLRAADGRYGGGGPHVAPCWWCGGDDGAGVVVVMARCYPLAVASAGVNPFQVRTPFHLTQTPPKSTSNADRPCDRDHDPPLQVHIMRHAGGRGGLHVSTAASWPPPLHLWWWCCCFCCWRRIPHPRRGLPACLHLAALPVSRPPHCAQARSRRPSQLPPSPTVRTWHGAERA